MSAQLNIKSEDAYRLASKLAEITGESLTTSVIEALREKLDREMKVREKADRLRKLREITADIRRHLGEPLPSSDHSWLYGDDGLPK